MAISVVMEEATRLFAQMDKSEKASALKMLEREAKDAFPGIQKTPGVQGGEACIGRSRITVWGIWRYRELGWSDRKILENYPSLGAEDIANAYAYARSHMDEIQKAIAENESDEDESE